MIRRLGIGAIIFAGLAFALLVGFRSGHDAMAGTAFAQAAWGDANCDSGMDSIDVLYMLTSFTNAQPDAPASCPRLPMTVFVDTAPYQWGDFNCSQEYDVFDVLDSVKFLAGLFTLSEGGAQPQGVICFDYLEPVEIYLPPPADDSLDLLAIDTNTSGNAATTLGERDTCRSVAIGQTFDVDVVVRGIPTTPGLIAFDHDFRYDPAVLQYVSNDPYFLIAANNGPSRTGITDYTDFGGFSIDINTGLPNPGTPNGHIYPTVYDYSYGTITPESGDGVLIRYTMKAIAGGTSPLSLHQMLGNELYPPTVGGTDFKPYKVPTLRGGEIRVDSACPGVTPTTTPTASPTPTAGPTPSPSPTPSPTPDPSLHQCQNINPTVNIDDDDPSGFTFTTTLTAPGTIETMSVCLNIEAQWAGDVKVTIQHDNGTIRTLIDRVGNHAGTCSGNGNGFTVYLTDFPSPQRSLEDACPGGFAGDDFVGQYYADDYLADETFAGTFDSETIAGEWKIKVSDNQAGGTVAVTGIELTIGS